VLRPPASTPSPLSSSLVPASAPASAPPPSPAAAAPVSAAAPPAAVSVSRGTAAPTIFSSRGGGGCAFAVSRPIGWHSRASATAAAAAVVSGPSLSATPPIPVAPPAAAIRFPPIVIHPTTLPPMTRGATPPIAQAIETTAEIELNTESREPPTA
ncbi:unnamed protein product, partial [Ectocarpus sp. 12 AP-2014]